MGKKTNIALTAERGIVSGPFELTKVGLQITGEPSLGEWEEAGKLLHQAEGAVHWWIGDWLLHGHGHYEHGQYKEALEILPFEHGTLRNDKYVAEVFELSRRRDNLSWSHHQVVAGLTKRDQNRWLDRAEKNEWSSRDLRKELKETTEAAEETPDLPEGIYNLIYADPPWRYDFSKSSTRKIENQYPTMELSDICDLDVSSIAHEDCVLFMWATSPKLLESMQVLRAWGFTYKTCMVWVKDKIGMGYYARQRHEILLIATLGEPSPPSESDRPDSVIEAPRQEHSRKPEDFYSIIETMYPKAEKVELFCREPREGWKAWGNEV